MSRNTLVLNAGSSSVKFRMFDASGKKLFGGEIDALGKHAVVKVEVGKRLVKELKQSVLTHEDAGKIILELVHAFSFVDALKYVVHRVVHGGAKYTAPVVVNARVLQELKQLISLAPLHQPQSLALITLFMKETDAQQIACFDTMFHRTMPQQAQRYALPQSLVKKYGLIRYGFHGLSHAALHQTAEKLAQKKYVRMITCQLGNGASVCAIRDGKSIDTSMGFTPLEGLPMGTRSGSIDPAILPFLCKAEKKTPQQILEILEKESGFQALAGASDVRIVRAQAERGEKASQDALDFFAYQVRKQIGSSVAALNGIDALVFGGGIVRAPAMRRRILSDLQALGIRVDVRALEKEAPVKVSRGNVDVWILETDEQEGMFECTKGIRK